MNAHEQEIARAIAPVVRWDCREVGLMMIRPDGYAGDAWTLAIAGEVGDDGERPCCWVSSAGDAWWEGDHTGPLDLAMAARVDGIPDLSDGACLDALIRWLATRRARIAPAPDEFLCFWQSALYVAQMKSLHRARADAIHAACRALWPEEVSDA